MNTNLGSIDLNGLEPIKIELYNTSIQEVREEEITAYLFDSFGVARFGSIYLSLEYPSLEEVKRDKQMRRTINQKCYGYRLPESFNVTVGDLASCFAEGEIVDYSEYMHLLRDGIEGKRSEQRNCKV